MVVMDDKQPKAFENTFFNDLMSFCQFVQTKMD